MSSILESYSCNNLKGYDSHLIFRELSKFNVNISFISNGLKKYKVFTINKNLFFIDSMQFMNSSLDSLVRNLVSEDFKYLFEECSGEKLKLVKEKRIDSYECKDSFKRFTEGKLPDKSKCFSPLKVNCISKKDYDRAIKVWNAFKIKTLGEYHDFIGRGMRGGISYIAKDIVTQIINTWIIMIVTKKVNLLCIGI